MAEIGYQSGALAGWAGLLAEIHEDNPDLRWPQSNDLWDRMRREDSQVSSVLRAMMLPIQRIEWTLDATGVRPEVADLVSKDLGLQIKGVAFQAPVRTKGRFSWPEHLRLALLSRVFGHAVFEQVYTIDSFGIAHLKKLAYRPPRTIVKFHVERDGGLSSVEQYGSGPDGGKVKIPIDRLVVYVNEREGANWTGVSVLRPAYKMWLLKDRTLRVQALAADRNGLGLPIYTAPAPAEDASYDDKLKWLDAEIERGLKIAKGARAGDAAGASLPNGASLTFSGVKGNLPDLDKQVRYYDEQIGRAVLAHVLNLGGDNSTGSYALGDTFARIFTDSLNAIALDMASTVQQHVIEDLVDLNFGDQEPAPRLVPATIGAEHPATAEAIKALLDSGAIHWDPALEAHLRALYRLPVRDENAPADDAEKARFAAETLQKVYLGVINQEEAREIVRRAGAQIDARPPAQADATTAGRPAA